MKFHIRCSWLCLVGVFFTSCNARPLELANQNRDKADGNSKVNAAPSHAKPDASKGDETLYYLDLKNPRLAQPLEGNAEVDGSKFVQVEVVKVVNARKYGLTFRVHYQPHQNEKIYLGSFSLYPSDHPGEFIVPTQGKVKSEGNILLTLETLDRVDSDTSLRVVVKKIRFTKGRSPVTPQG